MNVRVRPSDEVSTKRSSFSPHSCNTTRESSRQVIRSECARINAVDERQSREKGNSMVTANVANNLRSLKDSSCGTVTTLEKTTFEVFG